MALTEKSRPALRDTRPAISEEVARDGTGPGAVYRALPDADCVSRRVVPLASEAVA